jgi:protoporphyrinogen oxidase
MNLILGGGIAGLAASWHLGHDRCLVLEKSDVVGGHARSVAVNGFTLDHGPHVSFTRNAYVRDLFARNVGGSFIESDVTIANFYKRKLVHHPAQVHL